MAKKRRSALKFLLTLIVLGVISLFGLRFVRSSCVPQTVEIFIPSGSSYHDILDSLGANGVEKVDFISLVGRLKGADKNVKPGHYVFYEGTNMVGVVNQLRSGAQTPVKVTFNNIRTVEQLSARLAEQIEADSAAIATHLADPATAEKYGLKSGEVIGLFIPNTYEVWWTSTPEELTDRMALEWEKFWNESRTEKLARTGLSKMEVITLASIIYEETKNVGEMPKIAGVFINRLRKGIPLQSCATAKYALGDFSLKRVLYEHTQVKSPYNTYINRGLPPGPICTPSIATIDAVLGYTDHKYLYFCAKEDFSGTHNFATTLSEHNANSKRYHAALKKAGIK